MSFLTEIRGRTTENQCGRGVWLVGGLQAFEPGIVSFPAVASVDDNPTGNICFGMGFWDGFKPE